MENVNGCVVGFLVGFFFWGWGGWQGEGGLQRDNACVQVFPFKMKTEFSILYFDCDPISAELG